MATLEVVDVARLGGLWSWLTRRDVVPVYDLPLGTLLASVHPPSHAPQSHARGSAAWRQGLRRWGWVGVAFAAGWLLMLAGGLVTLTSLPESALILPLARAGLPLAFVGLPLMLVGGVVVRRAERRLQQGVAEARADDRRPPVLFLRSFRDDDRLLLSPRIGLGADDEPSAVRFELAMAAPLKRFGPLIAIGMPGEGLSRLGASRAYFSDAEWQAAIQRWMKEASLIVVTVGETKGLQWEIDQLFVHGYLGKTIFLFPPSRANRARRPDNQRRRRFAILRESLPHTAIGALPLPAWPAEAVALHLAGESRVVALTSAAESAYDYELAVQLAVYGLRCKPMTSPSAPT